MMMKLTKNVGACPGLYILATKDGEFLGAAWDTDKDIATLRILKDLYKRGYGYEESRNEETVLGETLRPNGR